MTAVSALVLCLLFTCLALTVYLAHKVRRVHLKLFDIDRAFEVRLDNHFRQVEALSALTRELGLPLGLQQTRGWAGSPDFLLHVLRAARSQCPQVVVECSCGVSTVVLARAMQLQGSGHVWSLEHNSEFAVRTRTELARHGLEDWATVLEAPLVTHVLRDGTWLWYSIADLPSAPIDLLVVDGPPMSTQRLARFPALPLLQKRLSASACIVLDDAGRADETEIIRRWVADYGLARTDLLSAEKGIAELRVSAR